MAFFWMLALGDLGLLGWRMQAPTLTTERLIIREIALSDFEIYADSWADPRTTAFIGGGVRDRNTSWAKFLQAAGMWPVLGFGYWIFADRETNAYLGIGGLSMMERGIEQLEGYVEVGWALAPDAWGRGLATEAVQAIVTWADAQNQLELRCIIDPENTPSIRVAEKNGFARIDEVENELGRSLVFSRQRP
jgi:RimJ/RimL family protein N-acetyltransferase